MSELLDLVRTLISTRHYSYRTEQSYVHWIKRYIRFQKMRHPAEMGAPEVTQFSLRSCHGTQCFSLDSESRLGSSIFSLPQRARYRSVLARPATVKSRKAHKAVEGILSGLLEDSRATKLGCILSQCTSGSLDQSSSLPCRNYPSLCVVILSLTMWSRQSVQPQSSTICESQ